MLVAGIGVLGYALLVAEDLYPMDDEGLRDGLSATPTSLVAVAAVSALVTVAWVVVARWRWGAGQRTGLSRRRLLVPVVVLLGAGIWSYWSWRQISRTAFPGDRLLLVTAVYGVMLLGVALVIVAAWRIRSRKPMPRLPFSAAAVAFVGALAAVSLAAGAVVAVAGERTRIDATTAAAVSPPPEPTDPSRVAWRWSNGSWVVDAVAAGAGVVVSSYDGIVALDGRTGSERWHYRRSDGFAHTLVAVDGGRGVMASFGGRLHAFDAFTGELWWREDTGTADVPVERAPLFGAGSTVIRLRQNPDAPGFEFVGRSTRSGELRWRYAPRPECDVLPDVVATTVLVISTSGDGCFSAETTVALDTSTGELLWRALPGVDVDVEGEVLEGKASPRDVSHLLDPRTGRTMGTIEGFVISGTASGEVIADVTGGGRIGTVERAGWALVDLGEPAHRWQAPAPVHINEGAAFLEDVVAILQQTESCAAGDGLVLVLLDRADGTTRRSFACDDLPREAALPPDSTIWPAPGALILEGQRGLVALG